MSPRTGGSTVSSRAVGHNVAQEYPNRPSEMPLRKYLSVSSGGAAASRDGNRISTTTRITVMRTMNPAKTPMMICIASVTNDLSSDNTIAVATRTSTVNTTNPIVAPRNRPPASFRSCATASASARCSLRRVMASSMAPERLFFFLLRFFGAAFETSVSGGA